MITAKVGVYNVITLERARVKNKNGEQNMDNHNDRATQTMREEKITSHDLVTEILLLLNDYFCGVFTAAADTIAMTMGNGQRFQLKVSEVA